MKQAAFPHYKTMDEFDFGFQTSVTRRQIQQLLDMHWLEKAFNILFFGPPGVGKSHLATGLGVHAVRLGYHVSFIDGRTDKDNENRDHINQKQASY